MPPRAPCINYEENNQWARTAKRICLIHDHLMDAFRIKNGLELDVGCRATPDPPCDGVKELADDYRGRGHELELIFFINKCLGAETMIENSPVDRKVLERMKEMYCAFAANQDLEIAPTNQYGDTQLMGLEYICFPIPDKQHTPPKYAQAFNEDYSFVNEKGKGFIQLGPAYLLNHHCDPASRNVNQFGAGHKRRLVADAILFQPSLSRSVAVGEELCINYGNDWFGDNNRKCLCSKGHPRTTVFPSDRWSSADQAIDSTPGEFDSTPRASRAKRRLSMSDSTRPKITTAPAIKSVKAMSTRLKEGTSLQRPHFKDDPSLKDLFIAPDDQEAPFVPEAFVPEAKRARRASSPSSTRPVVTDRVKHVLSTSTSGVKGQVKAVRASDIGSSSRATVQPIKNVSLTSMATGQARFTQKQDVGSSSMGMGQRVESASKSKSKEQTQTAASQNVSLSTISVARNTQSGQKAVDANSKKVAPPSVVQRSASTSTAEHILNSMSRANNDRPATSGQTISSKAIQAYGAGKSSSSLTTDMNALGIRSAGSSVRPAPGPRDYIKDQPQTSFPTALALPISTTALTSQSAAKSFLSTARLQLPTQMPSQPITQAAIPRGLPAAHRVTSPTNPTTRALVGFIEPVVAASRASSEVERIHGHSFLANTSLGNTSLEDTSHETLEGPEIATPVITHIDAPVPLLATSLGRLASLSPHPKREESPDLGSESSYYDRSLYGPSSPPCLPVIDPIEASHPSEYGDQSVNGTRSVSGRQSTYGARSVYDDLDPDALDDEEFELLVYGERIEAEGDEVTSDAEPMDICSEDGDSALTRHEGPAYGDPFQQWRADVV